MKELEDYLLDLNALINRHNQVERTRRHIRYYAETNSYQHCSWNYKAHEHVNSFWKIPHCLENIVCCSNSEREQSQNFLNARSILPKLDELRVLCVENSYDIVCIVESWLSDEVANTELCIPGFTIFRKDRNRHGGGIIVFVKNTLPCSILPFVTPSLFPTQLEFLPLCIEFYKHKFCISIFYRPPSADVAYFDTFCNVVESLDIVKYSNFILLGDFNIDFCNSSHPMTTKLTNFCNSLMLTQVVDEPTHMSATSNQSLIDLVFLSHPQKLKQCCVAPPLANSDHCCVNLSVTHRCGTTKSSN